MLGGSNVLLSCFLHRATHSATSGKRTLTAKLVCIKRWVRAIADEYYFCTTRLILMKLQCMWWDTSQRAATLEEAGARQEPGPQGTKGSWREKCSFKWIICGFYEKEKTWLVHSTRWQHTKWLLPGQTWAAVIWMAAGCCTSLTHHQSSVVVH